LREATGLENAENGNQNGKIENSNATTGTIWHAFLSRSKIVEHAIWRGSTYF
jgi:hypothetical protein